MQHLRYPEVMFEAQRQILAQYHVTIAQEFYGGQNFWSVPTDPSGLTPKLFSQPPYYLTMSMPGYRQPEFSLTTSFTPRGRANIAAYMAVDSKPGPGYGTIRLLQLPQDTAIQGPEQVQNDFESNTVVASRSPCSAGRIQGNPGQPVPFRWAGAWCISSRSTSPSHRARSVRTHAAAGAGVFDGRIGLAPALPSALAQVFTGVSTTQPSPPPKGTTPSPWKGPSPKANATV